MKRQSRAQVLDLSIHGDELEHNRIQLEHNLQNDLSIHLSSQDDEYNLNESVEYPRHTSGPSPLAEFGSFAHRSGDHFDDGDPHSAWSYRTMDDDEGINPYGAHTMSTAAHHASALTLNAGLGGGRGARREISLSGAEYDPDRPLHDMIAQVDSKLSMFDLDPSKSRHYTAAMSLDPVVVDSTAELDRVLQSGYAAPTSMHNRSVRLRSSSSHSSSTSSSDAETQSPRPKLSDGLRGVSFSPKRPRSASPRTKTLHLPDSQLNTTAGRPSSPLARRNLSISAQDEPTPKPTKRSNIFPSYASSQPEVRLHPPTPSSSGSQFTKMARGLTRELEREAGQSRWQADALMQTQQDEDEERNPFHDMVNQPQSALSRSGKRGPFLAKQQHQSYSTSRSKIHLPDVTGLTNAVESPVKGLNTHYPYQADGEVKEAEARLLNILSTVQAKLRQLEEENSISRRRVRELESELELCKKEVARERTRVMERDDIHVDFQQRGGSNMKRANGKGKERARNASMEQGDMSMRYKEVVEEKKALEALISSLRTHLTRLTAELSSHQQLLMDLRSMRESDARALKEKSAEIDRLREEVERLAGEVEVLRGVVEEGLKERRAAREASQSQSQFRSFVTEEEEEEDEEEEDELQPEETHQEEEEEDHDDDEAEPFDPLSIPGSSRENVLPDKTIRTDHATIGSSNLGLSTSAPRTQRFIDDDELERISAEIEERRSERSVGSAGSNSQLQSYFHSGEHERESRASSPVQGNKKWRRTTVEDVADADESMNRRAPSPGPSRHNQFGLQAPNATPRQRPSLLRPAAPTPAHGAAHNRRTSQNRSSELKAPPAPEAPFPQIRGARLERLFFSAEHDNRTCTMCQRRTRRPGGAPAEEGGRPLSPSWLPSRLGRVRGNQAREQDDDEGFVEGSEELDERPQLGREARRNGKQREGGPSTKLPPQTVLARVIQEMEDDFGHYKSVYVELADQYKILDAVSDVPKRNLVAQHLREVIDIIEQKGDQIASLYDLLDFKDKPETYRRS